MILPQLRYELWLDLEVPGDEVQEFLEPYPADEMLAEPVGAVVNNPRNDVPECVEAVG